MQLLHTQPIVGSSPTITTKFGDAATMVEWPRTVNPVLKKRNRFESYHLHQNISISMERSYNGIRADC